MSDKNYYFLPPKINEDTGKLYPVIYIDNVSFLERLIKHFNWLGLEYKALSNDTIMFDLDHFNMSVIDFLNYI